MSLRIEEVKVARSAYLHPKFMQNKNKLFDAFMVAVVNYFKNDSHIIVLQKMEEMIRVMVNFAFPHGRMNRKIPTGLPEK